MKPRRHRRGGVASVDNQAEQTSPTQGAAKRLPPEPAIDHEATTHSADTGPTITARLSDGPLKGQSITVEVIEGRPPKTIVVPVDAESSCRYCLADWTQAGPTAVYTFLYDV